jgi:arginase
MQMLFNVVAKNSADDTLVLTLGGDHSIGIGSVAGTLKAKPETAVIWVVRTSPGLTYTVLTCANI